MHFLPEACKMIKKVLIMRLASHTMMEAEGRIKKENTLSSEGCFQGLLCVLQRKATQSHFQTSYKFANDTLQG